MFGHISCIYTCMYTVSEEMPDTTSSYWTNKIWEIIPK